MKQFSFSLVMCAGFLCSTLHARMRVVEYCADFFPSGSSTEYLGYTLLTERPLRANVTYCAVPWGGLMRTNRLDEVPDINIGPAFTIYIGDSVPKLLPKFKKMGIDTVFACSPLKNEVMNGIKIIPFPFASKNTIAPAKQKDIFYTFIGAATHSSRKLIFTMHHPKNSVVKQRPKFHYYASAALQKEYEREYLDVLARARFSLCPRGAGTSSFRFWESLKPGAIPVLISDSLRLPDWFDWENCIVRVPENKVRDIPQILARITPEKEHEMRENCYKAYQLFQEQNLVSVVRHYFDREAAE